MKFRPPRFTVRRLAIVVAVISLAVGGEAIYRRLVSLSSQYRAKAVQCREVGKMHEVLAEGAVNKATTARHVRLARFYLELSEKYALAARHPWQSVMPDPPKPR